MLKLNELGDLIQDTFRGFVQTALDHVAKTRRVTEEDLSDALHTDSNPVFYEGKKWLVSFNTLKIILFAFFYRRSELKKSNSTYIQV